MMSHHHRTQFAASVKCRVKAPVESGNIADLDEMTLIWNTNNLRSQRNPTSDSPFHASSIKYDDLGRTLHTNSSKSRRF